VRCGNWFGLEGQHEPKDADSNADGAPLELYIGNMWWVDSGRDIAQTMDEIKQLGINMIRLPVTPQTLEPNNEQGMTRVWNGSSKNPNGRLKNTQSAYPYDNARQAMEEFIKLANTKGLKVLIDIHSCSNYVGWRAGRLDANPPWVDATREGYDYTREKYSCGGGGQIDHPYNESRWLANLRDIAGLPAKLNVNNIIGIDIFNEPWDYTWDQWATLSEKAYEAIDSVNKDLLVFVEGIGSALNDGTKVPHGDLKLNPNWGENFYGFNDRPLQIPRNRVVISPHTYGPSVFVQGHFMDGTCADLEGDEAGKEKCQINIQGNTSKMRASWDEHFGFLRSMNYAVVIGEFGGNMDWPNGTREAEKEMWGHITSPVDEQWQNAFVDYMKDKGIEACYWSINPESGDTGGIYTHEYDPVSAKDMWGRWGPMDTRKTNLLKRLWGN
jgi:endoglucanase